MLSRLCGSFMWSYTPLEMASTCGLAALGREPPGRTGEGAYPTPEALIFIAFQRVVKPHEGLV